MQSFKVLDHDADIRLEVYGTSMEELYRNAATAIFSLITNPANVSPALEKKITVSGNGELLINFLNELLFIWMSKGLSPSMCRSLFRQTASLRS